MNTGAPPRPPTARLASGAAVPSAGPAWEGGRGHALRPRRTPRNTKKAMLLPVKN